MGWVWVGLELASNPFSVNQDLRYGTGALGLFLKLRQGAAIQVETDFVEGDAPFGEQVLEHGSVDLAIANWLEKAA